MPFGVSMLFRIVVLAGLSAHVCVMYALARDRNGDEAMSFGGVVVAGLFAAVMLVPLVWALVLAELPAVYAQSIRAKRWWNRGRCGSCGHVIARPGPGVCSECGAELVVPAGYAFQGQVVWLYLAMNVVAWAVGCTIGEAWVRFQ